MVSMRYKSDDKVKSVFEWKQQQRELYKQLHNAGKAIRTLAFRSRRFISLLSEPTLLRGKKSYWLISVHNDTTRRTNGEKLFSKLKNTKHEMVGTKCSRKVNEWTRRHNAIVRKYVYVRRAAMAMKILFVFSRNTQRKSIKIPCFLENMCDALTVRVRLVRQSSGFSSMAACAALRDKDDGNDTVCAFNTSTFYNI